MKFILIALGCLSKSVRVFFICMLILRDLCLRDKVHNCAGTYTAPSNVSISFQQYRTTNHSRDGLIRLFPREYHLSGMVNSTMFTSDYVSVSVQVMYGAELALSIDSPVSAASSISTNSETAPRHLDIMRSHSISVCNILAASFHVAIRALLSPQ
ncbi:hypothetical protein M758_UG163600 [Ceratodon purpureus]|nr:hypothetical protein M758_UG163600 [Ceratodon purpureus]